LKFKKVSFKPSESHQNYKNQSSIGLTKQTTSKIITSSPKPYPQKLSKGRNHTKKRSKLQIPFEESKSNLYLTIAPIVFTLGPSVVSPVAK
jgi:hypothetical protein